MARLSPALGPTLAVVTLLLSGCSKPEASSVSKAAEPAALALLTGPPGGAYSPFGHALADVYNAKLKNVRVTATTINGPEGAGENAQEIEEGKAELGFSRADIAFRTFASASDEAGSGSHVRSIGVIYINAVHVVVRRASGIERGEQMRGHRVQVSDDGSPLARYVIEGHGLSLSDVTAVGNPRNSITRLKANELDVRIFASAYPLAGISDVGPSSPLALLSLSPEVIDRLRSRFPFFKPVSIPKGTYPGQADDIQTVGIDGLLLCRDTVPEEIVYELTKTLFESLGELATTQPSAKMIDGFRAQATAIPLHPGAARYYRERDLFR